MRELNGIKSCKSEGNMAPKKLMFKDLFSSLREGMDSPLFLEFGTNHDEAHGLKAATQCFFNMAK